MISGLGLVIFSSMDETKEYFSLLSGQHVYVVAAAAARKPESHRYVTTYLSNLFATLHFFFFCSHQKVASAGGNTFSFLQIT